MAPVLQCPDCGAQHPLDVASYTASFRCKGCGRILRVPLQFRAVAAAPPTAVQPRAQPAANAAPARAAARPAGGTASAGGAAPVPRSLRLLLWVVAVPVGFALVFGVARLLGVFTARDLEDVSLDEGWDRFWPVARLLPFVALAIALIVHFSVVAIARRRARRAQGGDAPPAGTPQPGSRVREPARPVS